MRICEQVSEQFPMRKLQTRCAVLGQMKMADFLGRAGEARGDVDEDEDKVPADMSAEQAT